METESWPTLDAIELRVLAVLVEKQMTTPDVYPLSRGAVVAGCNQATNRDPVMSLDETEVERALVRLHDEDLATPVRRVGDRVTKYRHKLPEALEIDEPAAAVLAVLMLRGPQTSGELRSRTERYVPFGSVDEVEAVIDGLESAGLARRLPRSPGQSQRRVTHLLGKHRPDEEGGLPSEATATEASPGLEDRLSSLESRFQELLERLGVDDL